MRYLKYLILLVGLIFLTTDISFAYNPPPATNLYALLLPRLIINLPLAIVETPSQIKIGATVISGLDTPGTYKKDQYQVFSSRVESGPRDPKAYYRLLVIGFSDKSNFTTDVKLVFKSNDGIATQDFLTAFKNSPNTYISTENNTFAGDDNCNVVSDAGATSLCLRLASSFYIKGQKRISNQTQKVSLNVITIKGNVAASGVIKSFNLDKHALAVSGSSPGIFSVNYGTHLENYKSLFTIIDAAAFANMENTAFQQSSVATHLTKDNYSIVNLNAVTDLDGGDSNSASNPPEGKLWYYDRNLTLSGEVKGSGTILVDGQVTIDRLACQNVNKTRFAVIAKGKIDITPSSTSSLCGTFITFNNGNDALNLNFPPGSNDDITTSLILVSQGSINLPSASTLRGNFTVNYYTTNPTALIARILSIAGLTTSE